jgi:hypothetical protein
MTNSRQNYRKNLDLKGFMFIGGAEHEMHVQNLSITGMLVSIDTSLSVHDVHDVFLLLKQSSLVDIFIEKLNLAGEAEVVRVDIY